MAQLINTKTGFITKDVGEWDKTVYKPESWKIYQPQEKQSAIPTTISTKQLSASDNVGEAINNAQRLKQYRDELKNFLKGQDVGIMDKAASPGFINAVARARYGRDASPSELGLAEDKSYNPKYDLIGREATVEQVLNKFGLSDFLPNYGIKNPPSQNKPIAAGEETAAADSSRVLADLFKRQTR